MSANASGDIAGTNQDGPHQRDAIGGRRPRLGIRANPRAAAGLLSALPLGDARTAAVTAIAEHWAAADTAAAFGWMRNLATPADRAAAQHGQAKLKLAEDLREFMGASAIDDSLRAPAWRANLMVDRERAACLADRRRG